MMTENVKRIIAGSIMGLGAIGAGVAEYFGIPAVRWLAVAIIVAMIIEYTFCLKRAQKPKNPGRWNLLTYLLPYAWLALMLAAAYFIGARPWIVLLMLLILTFADLGAFFFGRLFGGDKMWGRLSAGTTWAGQIAGIICGTFAAVMYGLLGTDAFLPQLLWIGISVSLLSQYGDLTASWMKRKLGIKDFGNIIPGHGGVIDRFDGWIYVLPIIWLVTL